MHKWTLMGNGDEVCSDCACLRSGGSEERPCPGDPIDRLERVRTMLDEQGSGANLVAAIKELVEIMIDLCVEDDDEAKE